MPTGFEGVSCVRCLEQLLAHCKRCMVLTIFSTILNMFVSASHPPFVEHFLCLMLYMCHLIITATSKMRTLRLQEIRTQMCIRLSAQLGWGAVPNRIGEQAETESPAVKCGASCGDLVHPWGEACQGQRGGPLASALGGDRAPAQQGHCLSPFPSFLF